MKTIMSNLGFVPVPYDHVLIFYLPNKDKNGNKFDVEPWETEALKLQGRLFRGATSYPGKGSYRQIDEHGKIVEEVLLEQTRLIESFIQEKDFTPEALKQIAAFLKRFKKETRQDSVAIVIDGEMYYL